jgi:hypothetical protein
MGLAANDQITREPTLQLTGRGDVDPASNLPCATCIIHLFRNMITQKYTNDYGNAFALAEYVTKE